MSFVFRLGVYSWDVCLVERLEKVAGVTTSNRLLPTGDCWCGCNTTTPIGAFFAPGHDKVAESAVIILEYGSVAGFLRHHGYGPGGKNARRLLEQHRKGRAG